MLFQASQGRGRPGFRVGSTLILISDPSRGSLQSPRSFLSNPDTNPGMHMAAEVVNARQEVLNNALDGIKKDDETLDPCVICLEAVSERAFAAPCRHENFDFLCLVSWLQERPTCPLCMHFSILWSMIHIY